MIVTSRCTELLGVVFVKYTTRRNGYALDRRKPNPRDPTLEPENHSAMTSRLSVVVFRVWATISARRVYSGSNAWSDPVRRASSILNPIFNKCWGRSWLVWRGRPMRTVITVKRPRWDYGCGGYSWRNEVVGNGEIAARS